MTASSDHSLTFQFKAYFPSGDGSRGLGTAHYSIEPSLLYYQRLSERWAVESQIGGWHPINGSSLSGTGANYAGDIFFYGFGPSYQLVNRENIKFAPVVELFGWHVLGGLELLGTEHLSRHPGRCQRHQYCQSQDWSAHLIWQTQLRLCGIRASGHALGLVRAHSPARIPLFVLTICELCLGWMVDSGSGRWYKSAALRCPPRVCRDGPYPEFNDSSGSHSHRASSWYHHRPARLDRDNSRTKC